MAKLRTIQLYRGTTAQNDAYTGSVGELTADTTANELRLHDGSTAGGHKIGRGYHPELLSHEWDDHVRSDTNWLRGDNFSWHDGTAYTTAYGHLVADISGKSPTTETVAGYTITVYLADDGHKICPASEETTVAAIFAETGIAWYYILDTTNTRFKLPRRHSDRVVQNRTYNDGTWYRLYADGWIEQGGYNYESAFTRNAWFSVTLPIAMANTNYRVSLDFESRSGGYHSGNSFFLLSDTYTTSTFNYAARGGDNAVYKVSSSWKVEGWSGMSMSSFQGEESYLYFYVGQFSHTALEETAGLNSSLFTAKADIDAANLNGSGKSLISALALPSSTRYDDLTMGASGTTYTAPANGYFVWWKSANGANQYCGMSNNVSGMQCFTWTPANGGGCQGFLPAQKGDECFLGYNAGGAVQLFRFIYTKGDENV